MANQINVLLAAKDGITPVVSKMKASVNGLLTGSGGIIGSIGKVQGGLSGMLAGVQLGAGMSVFTSTMGTLRQGLDLVTDGVSMAAKAQTTIAVTGSTIAAQMGGTLSENILLVKSLRKEFATMAADLPGEVKDFTNAANPIMVALATQKLSKQDFKSSTIELTKLAGFMAATTGSDAGYTGTQFGKLLAPGASYESVQRIDVFERSPGFQAALKDVLASTGKTIKDFTTLSQRAKLAVMSKVGKIVVNDELVNELGGGLDAQLSTFISSITDPDIGLFGFLKEISAKGGKTGLEAASQLFKSFLDLGQVLGKLIGFNPDNVMVGIINVMEFLTSINYSISQILGGGDTALFGEILTSFINDLPGFVSSFVQSLSSFIKTVNWLEVGFNVGKIFGAIVNAFVNIDRMALASLLFEGIKGLFLGLLGAIGGFMAEVLTNIVNTLNGFGEKFVQTFSDVSAALKTALDTAKSSLPFGLGNVIPGLPSTTAVPEALPSVNPSANTQLRASTYAPVISVNATPGMDTEALASLVMNKMNESFMSYRDASLA